MISNNYWNPPMHNTKQNEFGFEEAVLCVWYESDWEIRNKKLSFFSFLTFRFVQYKMDERSFLRTDVIVVIVQHYDHIITFKITWLYFLNWRLLFEIYLGKDIPLLRWMIYISETWLQITLLRFAWTKFLGYFFLIFRALKELLIWLHILYI